MKYRKKPVVIEAEQYPLDASLLKVQRLIQWCGGARAGKGIIIHTLEGDHLASPGDYIIQGIQGEFYPCKPDIFEATYEEWSDETSHPQ
jgi:hypothetical protein